MVESKRKGASKVSDVPAAILAQLEAGEIESATLSEGLAINFGNLIAHLFPDLAETAALQIDAKAGITKRMLAASNLITAEKGQGVINKLANSPSDTVRGWAAYAIATQDETLATKLERLKPFANDNHFGVREWAWLAVRPDIVDSPKEAVALLEAWTAAQSEYVRRFAVEAIRPRGVWSSHIKAFKSNPELALQILEPLKTDQSRYVQDSVSNWLNDAYKSQPDWVLQLCETWRKQSQSDSTSYITKRALRSHKR